MNFYRQSDLIFLQFIIKFVVWFDRLLIDCALGDE